MDAVPSRMALTRALLLALLGVTFAIPSQAQAACGEVGRPWVSLAFSEADWPRGFSGKVLGDLRAGLTSRGIDACPHDAGPSTEPPLATVRIAKLDGKSVAVSVEIRDAVTEKRVARDVDLARVPPDGRAFAIAIAVDELVWASWAEIALAKSRRATKRAASPSRPSPPPEVVEGVEQELPSEGRPSELAVRFAGEHYLGGQTHLGADAATLLPLGERFTLDLGAGIRQGLRVSAPDGSVLSSAIGLGAGLRFAILHAPVADVGFSLGVRAAVARFRGAAAPGAEQSELSGLTAFARLGAFTAVHLGGAFRLDASVGGGLPLRALEATDNGRVVTGVSGIELFALLGPTVEL
jgi:hypothetical protein